MKILLSAVLVLSTLKSWASKDYLPLPPSLPGCSAVLNAGEFDPQIYMGESVSRQRLNQVVSNDKFSEVRREFLEDALLLISDLRQTLSFFDMVIGGPENQVRALYSRLTEENWSPGPREVEPLIQNYRRLLEKIEAEEGGEYLAHALRAAVYATLQGALVPPKDQRAISELNHRNAIAGIAQDLILLTHLYELRIPELVLSPQDSFASSGLARRVNFEGKSPLEKVLSNVSSHRINEYRQLFSTAIRATADRVPAVLVANP